MPGTGRPRRKAAHLAEDESAMEQMTEHPDLVVPEHESDGGSEPEDSVVAKGRGKKRGKKTDGDISAKKKRAPGGQSRGKKKDDVVNTEGTLFEIVKSGKSALTAVVDEWIEAYKNDRDAALLDLIQFFIHSSGCRGRITPQMYASMEHAEIIRKMTEEFDEESGDYPLIMPGPMWKKFRMNLCEFIMVLVRQCQYSIIYDQYMMDNIISLLTGLTDSQVRAFRHTSTLASMKLMTALVDVALNLSINLDHTQRQYEAERQKNRSKQASERLEMLMAKRQEIEENQEEIRNMLTYIFKGVFVHRYRDTQPEIRAICMSEIGLWMKRYPSMFLDDSYLKYVGWTLYDRVGEVRLCCLKCLNPLYHTDELAPKLELFTNRFKDRIVEMTLDKEYEVAVQGVKLVISVLSRYGDQVLSDKDCENVYELVYSSHRAVAQAAGEFLNSKLFSREVDEVIKNLKTKKGKKRSENTPLIRDLVQFFIESELHEHGAYLVDSLWEINDMLKDWECMTDLLLEEPGRGEEPMDDRQETSLIEIMVCCVKQAATGEYPVGRGPSRKLTAKEAKQVGEDKTKLTEHFIVTLPQLLAKYSVDDEKVANLLQVPKYFDLEIYTTSRQEKHLDALLRHIDDIVDKHTDTDVLDNCAKVMENFCDEDYTISGKCNVAKSTLIDRLAEKYKEAFQDFFTEGEDPDEDDAYALMASLKRINAFYGCHDLNAWELWDSLFSIVKGCLNGNVPIPEAIVCKSISCCMLGLLWYLQALNEQNPDKVQMKHLKKKLNHFMRANCDLLYSQHDRVAEEAFVTVADLLIVFSKQLAGNPVLKPIMFEPDRALQAQLSGFLTEKVFIEEEDDNMDENQKIEELHKRRNFLASFCKLIIYNVLPIRCAADTFKHYMKFYNDYGDIIKATLGKSREINKVQTAKTLALSLTQLFHDVLAEHGFIDRSSEQFQAIKELARRFSLSFGLDQVKNREAVAAMHQEGIVFSLSPLEDPENVGGPPPNLSFLEVLAEFTSKLMRQDKKTVLAYMDKHLGTGGVPAGREEEWAPMLTYRSSLMQGETDLLAMPQPRTAPPGRKGKGAKRKLAVAEVDASGQWHSKHTPARGMPGPLTSTAVKRRRGVPDTASDAGTETPQESEAGSEQDFETEEMNISKRRRLNQVQEMVHSFRERLRSSPRLSTMVTRLSAITSHRPNYAEDEDDDAGSINAFESPLPSPKSSARGRHVKTPTVLAKASRGVPHARLREVGAFSSEDSLSMQIDEEDSPADSEN